MINWDVLSTFSISYICTHAHTETLICILSAQRTQLAYSNWSTKEEDTHTHGHITFVRTQCNKQRETKHWWPQTGLHTGMCVHTHTLTPTHAQSQHDISSSWVTWPPECPDGRDKAGKSLISWESRYTRSDGPSLLWPPSPLNFPTPSLMPQTLHSKDNIWDLHTSLALASPSCTYVSECFYFSDHLLSSWFWCLNYSH